VRLDGDIVKIAYFAEIFPSTSETWVHHEISQLIELGCDVRVFATHARPTTIAPELMKFCEITTYLPEIKKSLIEVLRVFCSPTIIKNVLVGVLTECPRNRHRLQVLRDIVFTGFFSKNLAGYSPQFILVHFGGTRANLALIWSMKSGIPFGIKFHAADVFNRVALFRSKVKRAAMLMTISRFNIEFMRKQYPDIDVSRFEIHKCGIPIEEYHFQPKSKSRNPIVIMAAGRLVPMKGFAVLLRASKRLLEKGYSHKVKIFGNGPECKRLEQLIEALSLHGTVDLMGYVSPDNVRAALLDSDIFVLPAVFDPVEKMDGIPVALMEAMALGVPVISTNISGIPELIEHGMNGYLCDPDDPVSLSQAILTYLETNEKDRRRMLLAARMKIEIDHDVRKLATLLTRTWAGAERLARA
jgi:glycosyltransferase involved in cell wall biosynthesis